MTSPLNTQSFLRLVLAEPVSGLTGATFTIENVPKAGFVFTKSGNKLETGTDFR